MGTIRERHFQFPFASIRQSNSTAIVPYERLHRWSTTYIGPFWSEIWDYAGIVGEKGKTPYIPAESMADAIFFPEATLNFAENLLLGQADKVAAYQADESGVTAQVTFLELRKLVAKAQTGLKQLGVGKGDRVAGITTNNIEGLVALLATASLGAVWTSCSPDFGSKGIIDRIGQVQPKILLANLTYQYKQKSFDISDKVQETIRQINSISHVVTMAGEIPNASNWEDLIDNDARYLSLNKLDFVIPYIFYILQVQLVYRKRLYTQ